MMSEHFQEILRESACVQERKQTERGTCLVIMDLAAKVDPPHVLHHEVQVVPLLTRHVHDQRRVPLKQALIHLTHRPVKINYYYCNKTLLHHQQTVNEINLSPINNCNTISKHYYNPTVGQGQFYFTGFPGEEFDLELKESCVQHKNEIKNILGTCRTVLLQISCAIKALYPVDGDVSAVMDAVEWGDERLSFQNAPRQLGPIQHKSIILQEVENRGSFLQAGLQSVG